MTMYKTTRLFLLFALLGVAAEVAAQPGKVMGVAHAEPPQQLSPAQESVQISPATVEDARSMRLVPLSPRVQSASLSAPSFPGGADSLSAFLRRHLLYPAEAKTARLEGTVRVSFVVDTAGRIEDIRLRSDIGHGCGAEAVRVVSLMPRWEPSRDRQGRPVRVETLLPVRFELNDYLPDGVNLDPSRPEADEGSGLFVD